MIRNCIVAVKPEKDGLFAVYIGPVKTNYSSALVIDCIDVARHTAEKMAKDNGGTCRFTNVVHGVSFNESFYLVEWDDEAAKQKKLLPIHFAFKERQFMPALGAVLSFMAAFQIGRTAETSRDWFLFYVMVISFACSTINAWEARK